MESNKQEPDGSVPAANSSTEFINKGSFISVGELWKKTFQIFFSRFWALAGVVVVPYAAFVVFLLLFGTLIGIGIAASSFVGIVLLAVGAVLLVVLSLLMGPWIISSMIYAIQERDARIGPIMALKRGRHFIFSNLWVNILISIIIAGGMLLFIIPGFVFAVWFGFAFFVVVNKGVKGMNALLYSRELVRGHGWRVLGRWALLFGVMYGVFFLPVILVYAVTGSFAAENLIFTLIFNIFSYVFGISFGIFFAIYGFLMYESLRDIKKESVPTEFPRKKRMTYILFGIIGVVVVGGLILFGFVLGPLNAARTVAQDSRMSAGVQAARLPLELFYAENARYPETLEEIDTSIFEEYVDVSDIDYMPSPDFQMYQLCVELSEETFCIESPIPLE